MEKKKKSTLFTRLFGNRNKVTDFMTEEQLQSPGRLILKNFLHNKLGMIGLIVFLLIFLLVMIGPKFYTLDLLSGQHPAERRARNEHDVHSRRYEA